MGYGTIRNRVIICCLAVALVSPAQGRQHNSKNSLDVYGTYLGALPCADCDSIETAISLHRDLSFFMQLKYAGKSAKVYESRGTFRWDEAGGKITLSGNDSGNHPSNYLVGEHTLTQLDLKGNVISGNLASRYVLKKADPGLVEKYWKLTELNGKPVLADATRNHEPHIVLRMNGKQVQGNGGCNSFRGGYQVMSGGRISFSGLASTMMACPAMDVETEFLKALGTADNYVLNGDSLVLNKARMAPLARFTVVYLR